MLGSIVISNHCQLSCSYCSTTNKNTSPILSYDQISDFIVNNLTPGDLIEFYGGEPLLHFDIISKVMTNFPDYYYNLYTNGMFDSSLVVDNEKIFNKFNMIMVSLDGITTKANSFRKISDQDISTILTNFDILSTLDSYVIIGSVLLNEYHYSNIQDYLSYLVKNHKCHGVSFEAVTVVNDDKIKMITPHMFANLIDAVSRGMSLNLLGYPFFVSLPREFLSVENYQKIYGDVNCSENVIALSPRGSIYHCREHAANEEGALLKSSFKGVLINGTQIKDYSNKNNLKEIEKFCSCHTKGDQIGKDTYLKMFFIQDEIIQNYLIYPIFNWINLTKIAYGNNVKNVQDDIKLFNILNETLKIMSYGLKHLEKEYLGK